MKPNTISYCSAMHACAKSNDLDRAEFWLSTMCPDGFSANLIGYNGVIDGCAKVGQVAKAEFWFSKMVAAGIAAEVLLGPAIASHRAVAEFQRPGGSPVLCLTSRHVSGLNLHATSHVIFVHPYCNPSCASAEVVLLADAAAYETQAIGRIARYPNARSCHVHRIWCRGTIEEELYRVWGFIGEEEEGLPEGASEAASP